MRARRASGPSARLRAPSPAQPAGARRARAIRRARRACARSPTLPAARRARSRIARSLPGRSTGLRRPPSDTDDGQVDAVLDGQPEEEPRLLVGTRETELGPRSARAPRHVLAEELDVPARGGKVAADDVEQRRLSGAVRAEDRATLAGLDVEIDVVARREARRNAGRPPASGGSARRCNR